ncbi:hypothetical protein BLOT_008763 [Blomia tropicalis]|nr:hypothetical protein BLOT_008763 [Blomia tropicalis]
MGQESWYSTTITTDRQFPIRKTFGENVLLSLTTSEEIQLEDSVLQNPTSNRDYMSTVVENIYLNTNGYAIVLDDLHKWSYQKKKIHSLTNYICFTLYLDDSTQIEHLDHFMNIKIDIIAAENIVKAHQIALKEFIRRPSVVPNKNLFLNPVWSFKRKNKMENQILELTMNINQTNFGCSQLILDSWQSEKTKNNNSDIELLEFSSTSFGICAKNMIKNIIGQGCDLALTIRPTLDNNQVTGLYQKYMVQSTTYEHDKNHILDLTNPETINWFVKYLKSFSMNYGLSSFAFMSGQSTTWAEMGVFTSNKVHLNDQTLEKYPNLMTTLYAEMATLVGSPDTPILIDSAYRTQNQPLFILLPPKRPSWDNYYGIGTIIIDVLTLSLAGYPFVIPDINFDESQTNQELYIRWIQVMTFLPVMHLSTKTTDPILYKKWGKTIATVVECVKLHKSYASTFNDLAKKWIDNGELIIRPIWYLDPDDMNSYTINDQFMVGDKIMVAPVITQQPHRSIYFPIGKWECKAKIKHEGTEQSDDLGTIFNSKGTTLKFNVPIEELPYFIKVE